MLFYALKLFVLELDLRCKIVLLKFLSLRGLRVLHNSKAIVQNSFIVHKSVVLTAPLTQIHERSILDNGEDVRRLLLHGDFPQIADLLNHFQAGLGDHVAGRMMLLDDFQRHGIHTALVFKKQPRDIIPITFVFNRHDHYRYHLDFVLSFEVGINLSETLCAISPLII